MSVAQRVLVRVGTMTVQLEADELELLLDELVDRTQETALVAALDGRHVHVDLAARHYHPLLATINCLDAGGPAPGLTALREVLERALH
jgi:hypothetical protein